MEEMVTVSLDKYEDLLMDNYNLTILINELNKKNKMISELLLNEYLDYYNVKEYSLEEITDISNFKFALKKITDLLQCFTLDELTDFIRKKKQECEVASNGR